MCALENWKGNATNRFAVKFSIQPNSSETHGHSFRSSASVAKLEQFKRTCWKNSVNTGLFCYTSSHLWISKDPCGCPGLLPKKTATGLLELIPMSTKARLSGKASNRNVKLPLMDNWPQALGEILQFLITLTAQILLSYF